MKAPQLSLYQFDSCPYCRRVRDALERLDLQIEMRDTRANPAYRDELLAATGKSMVPCLRIEGGSGPARWMHESADIVRFLESEFGARHPA
jgi:glutathione S-transferase